MYKLRIESVLRVASAFAAGGCALAMLGILEAHNGLGLLLIPVILGLALFTAGGMYRIRELVDGIRDFFFDEYVDE